MRDTKNTLSNAHLIFLYQILPFGKFYSGFRGEFIIRNEECATLRHATIEDIKSVSGLQYCWSGQKVSNIGFLPNDLCLRNCETAGASCLKLGPFIDRERARSEERRVGEE